MKKLKAKRWGACGHKFPTGVRGMWYCLKGGVICDKYGKQKGGAK